MPQNPNCDGDKCKFGTGEVRVYPLGGGGNLILCRACFDHENRYRRSRWTGFDRQNQENWPIISWAASETYNTGA